MSTPIKQLHCLLPDNSCQIKQIEKNLNLGLKTIAMVKRGCSSFSNKRGTIVTKQMVIHIGMLALVAVVYFFLKGYVDSIQNDAQFEMDFLTRDLALLSNTLYSAPGNVQYEYSLFNKDLNNFNFQIGSRNEDATFVKVGGFEQIKKYPYGKNFNDKEQFTVSNKNSLRFSKEDNKIKVG